MIHLGSRRMGRTGKLTGIKLKPAHMFMALGLVAIKTLALIGGAMNKYVLYVILACIGFLGWCGFYMVAAYFQRGLPY